MTVNSQQRRHLLLAITGLLLLAAAVRYSYLLDSFTKVGDLPAKEKRISKLEQQLARRDVLQQQLVELSRQTATAETGLLNGKTPALAAVDLQNRLTTLITGSGAAVTSQRVLPSPPQDNAKPSPYVEIPVQIVATMTVRQLKDFLYGLGSSPVFLRVNEAEVRVAKRGEAALQTTITVSGLMAKADESQEIRK